MHQRQVGATDTGEGGADQDPAGAGRHWRADVANLDREGRTLLGATALPPTPTAGARVHQGRVDN